MTVKNFIPRGIVRTAWKGVGASKTGRMMHWLREVKSPQILISSSAFGTTTMGWTYAVGSDTLATTFWFSNESNSRLTFGNSGTEIGREPRMDEGTASSLSWKWQGAPRMGRQTPSNIEGTSFINSLNVDWISGKFGTSDGEVVIAANTQAWGYWAGSIPSFFCVAFEMTGCRRSWRTWTEVTTGPPELAAQTNDAENWPSDTIGAPVAVIALGPWEDNGMSLNWHRYKQAGMASMDAPESGSIWMNDSSTLQAGVTLSRTLSSGRMDWTKILPAVSGLEDELPWVHTDWKWSNLWHEWHSFPNAGHSS